MLEIIDSRKKKFKFPREKYCILRFKTKIVEKTPNYLKLKVKKAQNSNFSRLRDI